MEYDPVLVGLWLVAGGIAIGMLIDSMWNAPDDDGDPT